MRRAPGLIALWCGALACGLAACSSSSKPASAPTTTRSTTTPVATTTTVAVTTTSIPTTLKESAYVRSVDPAGHTITVDPMEFLTGPAATTEYRKDNPGVTDTPPNDYYIDNPTKDAVVLPFDPTAQVVVVDLNSGTVAMKGVSQVAFAQLPGRALRPFWLTIERGVVVRVEEQFVP